MVDKMLPDEDPTEKFISRKHKLDEVRDIIGEDLYQYKMNQLKDEFKKLSALN
jgi:hypothetical protein